MQRLEVSGAVQLIYRSLGVKGLRKHSHTNIINILVFVPYLCTYICIHIFSQPKHFILKRSFFEIVKLIRLFIENEEF